jgi:hypothetical protein
MRFREFLLTVLLAASLALPFYAQPAPAITSLKPPLSEPGLPVYIAGSNLTGATSVTFNGKNAPFLVDSSELVVALVPPGTTSGLVQVATPSGTATSSQAFDIVSAHWDAVRDFSTVSNPNGAWTYGDELSLGGAFNPFPLSATLFTDGPCWYNGAVLPNEAYVCLSTSQYTQQQLTVIVPNDMLYMGAQTNVVVARWTAPSSGTFWILGQFRGLDLLQPQLTIAIYENGTQPLYTNSLGFFGDYQDFSLSNVTLQAGTTIDFAVTSTDLYDDNVGLAARIDQIR